MPDENDITDLELNDILVYQLAKHIEENEGLHPYQTKDPQTDLFEYDEKMKIEVEPGKLGLDILQKINDNGK